MTIKQYVCQILMSVTALVKFQTTEQELQGPAGRPGRGRGWMRLLQHGEGDIDSEPGAFSRFLQRKAPTTIKGSDSKF